ncbi:hypothetical protein ACS0TY_000516 [Phlomoides rotata]
MERFKSSSKLPQDIQLTNVESLYDDRQRWVPLYMKDIFLAGLSPPQRLESVVSVLDKCLLRKTSLKEFLHQYNIMLQERYEDEAKADFETWHRQPVLKSPSPYGKQMATIYTHAVFKKFQVEVLGVVACHPKIESTMVQPQHFGFKTLKKIKPVMIVLQISGVNNIPPKYILKHWTKDAKDRGTVRQVDLIESRNLCYNDICQRACKLGEEGSLCQKSYSVAFTAMEEAISKCMSINHSVQTVSGPSFPSNYALCESEELTRGAFGAGGDSHRGALLGSNGFAGAFEFSSISH